MKKIVVCVPDDVVGTIVSLIAEYVTEMHVTSVAEASPPASSGRTRTTVPTRARREPLPHAETRVGRIIMGLVPESGERVLIATLRDAVEAGKFRPTSTGPMISKLVAARMLYRHGRDHVARVPAPAEPSLL